MKTVDQALTKYEKYNDLDDKLMTYFNEAMKDEVFSKLVGKLKLTYEELSKYTSILEECSSEYSNCLKCKHLMECKNKIEGYAYMPEVENGKLIFGYKPCKYKKRNIKETDHLKNVYTLFEPSEIREAKMEDIYLKDSDRMNLISFISKYIENYRNGDIGKGLYLYGSFGSGKTYLISAMFNELAKDGIKSAIIFWPDFLSSLKSSFGKDDYEEKMMTLKKSKLLLIDDIGAENTTPWGRDDVLCPILQYRKQEKLPTFFTSNLDKKALEQHFSMSKDGVEVVKARRIMERINQLTLDLELVSKNLRK